MRRFRSAVVLAPALAALLVVPAACGSDKPGDEAAKSKNATIADVKVTGATDKKPKVTFDKPYSVKKTESKVLSNGDGATIKEGMNVLLHYVGINGRDGKEFDSSWKRGEPTSFPLNQGGMIKGFVDGLVGKKVGSRVVLSITSKDGYPQGNGKDIKKGDSLIFVVDLKKAYTPLTKATGAAVEPDKSLPKVKLAKGIPTGVEKPKGTPPNKLVVQPLVKGEGKKITKSSQVNVQMVFANWRDGRTLTSTWQQGQAMPMPIGDPKVKKWAPGVPEAVIGQTVGSRVMIVAPPDKSFIQGMKPADLKQGKVSKDDTIIFIIDILDAQ